MVTQAKIGYGTTFKWGGDFVAELTRVGAVKLTAAKVDATTLGSPDSYRDILPGLIDPGDVEIEGLFRPDDTAQAALITDMNARTSRTCIIAFPTALSTAIWTFDAYCTGFAAGDATPEGIIPFSATLSIVGKPALTTSMVAGMTALSGIEQTGTAPLVILPAIAVGTYTYAADYINAASGWIKLTVTAGGSQVIKVTVLGVVHVLTTTVQSEQMTIGAAATVTPVYIEISEAAKSPRNYTLYIPRPA